MAQQLIPQRIITQCVLSDLQTEPTIVATSDSVRIAYRKSTGGLICLIYRASGDNGLTWSQEDYIGYDNDDHYPHLVMVNNIPHAIFLRPHPINTYLVLHAKPDYPVWEKSTIMNFGNYRYPLLAVDQFNHLHAVWERADYSIWYARSLDNGDTWQDIAMISDGSLATSLTTYHKGILIVYQWDNQIRGRLSTDFGANWEEPFIIDGEANAYEAKCFIISGTSARHLAYQKLITNPDDYDLVYMANDDLLLADDNRATVFNNGRHLIRDPLSNRLHLVYVSQGRPHYSWSLDNGQTWAPYHIIENVHLSPVKKDSGYYPSVGLHPGMLTAQQPCVVYIDNEKDVEYRYYDDWGGEWRGFTILSYTQSGLEPGPPSLYTQGDQVYVVFSVTNWGIPQYQFISAVYSYQFAYNATNPGNPVILDWASNTALNESRPSIVVDGNGNPHCTWCKIVSGNEDIYYRWRNGSSWQPIVLVSNQSPNYADKSPHIDCYGDTLSVVWYDEISGVSNEIFRRRKNISRNRWFAVGPSYSQSPGTPSEFPVNAAHDFSIWCEIGNASDYDIRYRSDTYGYGWVSQEIEKESFCHSQVQRDFSPWDLYTIFTKGNTTPYQIICVHQQFGSGPPGTLSALYTVETGEDTVSAFCVSRDGAIKYANHRVDYGTSALTYNLSILDPTFPLHLIKGKIYFEGTGNKIQELWINNEKKKTFVVKANEAKDFVIPIPKELYQNTRKITLALKNPHANGVYLSGLEVYRIADVNYGGPQSSESKELKAGYNLTVAPNPFAKKLEIKCEIPESRQDISLKIYDVSGRLVKSFTLATPNALLSPIHWDGTDGSGKKLPNGIYFLELQTGNGLLTNKVI
ncbi:MAG: FlgD immunoglobulin-like domain containing protein [bacterium]